jgi:hypothetical protein
MAATWHRSLASLVMNEINSDTHSLLKMRKTYDSRIPVNNTGFYKYLLTSYR